MAIIQVSFEMHGIKTKYKEYAHELSIMGIDKTEFPWWRSFG
jgi:hypothetical protein